MNDFDIRGDIARHYIEWIQWGKPELGWAGDPGLTLTFSQIEARWELLRHDPRPNQPDRYVIEARGPVGAELNDDAVFLLIRGLVDRTVRRGNSHEEQFDRMLAENDRIEAANEQTAADETADALGKFYHEAGKAMGVTKTFFPQG